MIIFYHKDTGRIYGSILGRVHSEYELKTPTLIKPMGVDPKKIKKKIFSIKETIKFEKLTSQGQFKIMDKKVIVDKSGKYNGLAEADKIIEIKPEVVETIIIDLARSLKEISVDFSKTTKQGIKKAKHLTFREIGFKERDVVYKVLEEIEDLKDIKIAKHILRTRAPFLDGLRRIYVVENKGKESLAVALITVKVDNFVYTLGGVTKKGRNTHAGEFLVYNLIKDAKELGYKKFDLGGIYADWADETKKKVNEFKRRWGGERTLLTC